MRAVHDHDRRANHPLPPRPLARAGCAPADPHARMAGLGRRVSRRHRTPDRGRVRSGDPVAARLRLLRSDARDRMEPVPHGEGMGRADATPRVWALRRGRQRRRIHDQSRARADRSGAHGREPRHPDLLVPLGRPGRDGRPDRRGAAAARNAAVVLREQVLVQSAHVAAAADPGVRAGRFTGWPSRVERPAVRGGPGRRLRPDQRIALLVHGNRRFGGAHVLRGRARNACDRAHHDAHGRRGVRR